MPGADVRFIAINNGVDSANQQDSDFTPFLNIINEWYAKDTSKKIRAVFKAKGESGKPLCTNPPYGYLKDSDDKHHWIVDDTAADVVREIFRLCIRIFSMLITWTMDSLMTASDSMRSRGSSLRGRTAFSIYRFDNRDRLFVIAMFTCITMTLMAIILGLTDMAYDPRMIWKPIQPLTILFYAGYTVLCLMPLGLELWTEHQFKKARNAI